MPHSDQQGKDVALSWYREIVPATVVDVGAGSGTYARLMRTVGDDEDRWFEMLTPAGERVQTSVRDKWRAIEAWKPYLDEFALVALYDEILVADARTAEASQFAADLVIFGDVLEHMTRTEAQALLAKAQTVAANIIVSIPVLHLDQDAVGGNPYERHVDHWSYQDMPHSHNQEDGMPNKDWSLLRWIRESRRYMRGAMPWWKFYPRALAKWPAFNRQQKADRSAFAAAQHLQH